jgi:hypothetical protein
VKSHQATTVTEFGPLVEVAESRLVSLYLSATALLIQSVRAIALIKLEAD